MKPVRRSIKEEICVICLEGITEQRCELDSCEHIYHLDCIKKWVKENENSCPCCKATVKTLIYGDIRIDVEMKNLNSENFLELFCPTCHDHIPEVDINTRTAPPLDLRSYLCEHCGENAYHFRCIPGGIQEALIENDG